MTAPARVPRNAYCAGCGRRFQVGEPHQKLKLCAECAKLPDQPCAACWGTGKTFHADCSPCKGTGMIRVKT